jgi:hypothetical protein
MNELQTQTAQLPETIEEVVDFVVVNEEKLNAVKAAIRAAKKAKNINLEELERQQRELEITTVLAQCRLGELTKEMTKAQGARTDITSSDTRTKCDSKQSKLNSIGITKQRASEYERMAAHPDIVQKVIDSGKDVTKTTVLREITDQKLKPLREEKNRELREAKKRHEEYVDTKTETIVSFADASQDKKDMHILSAEFISRLSKILMDISALGINSKTEQEIDDLVSGDFDPGLTRTGLLIAERSLFSIRSAVERRL